MQKSIVASQKSIVASQKSSVASQKSIVASQKSSVALQKSSVALQKSSVALQKIYFISLSQEKELKPRRTVAQGNALPHDRSFKQKSQRGLISAGFRPERILLQDNASALLFDGLPVLVNPIFYKFMTTDSEKYTTTNEFIIHH
jgi:hypothetical protein